MLSIFEVESGTNRIPSLRKIPFPDNYLFESLPQHIWFPGTILLILINTHADTDMCRNTDKVQNNIAWWCQLCHNLIALLVKECLKSDICDLKWEGVMDFCCQLAKE